MVVVRLLSRPTRANGAAGPDADAGASSSPGSGRGASSVGELARRAGRVALWATLALIFVRGLGAIAAGPQKPVAAKAPVAATAVFPTDETRAFAVRFTRAYLSWRPGDEARHAATVAPFFSTDLRDSAAAGLPRRGPGQTVAQATVARSTDLGSGRALITVASQLAHGRTVYLTVPVARDGHAGLDVFALPALTAPPPAGAASVSEPDPLTGPAAGEIQTLMQRFLTAYVAGGDPSGLAYLVAPRAAIASMPPGLALGSVDQVSQVGVRGARMTVQAAVHVRDRATGASYPLAYRLTLVHTDRWYVTGVQGGPQA